MPCRIRDLARPWPPFPCTVSLMGLRHPLCATDHMPWDDGAHGLPCDRRVCARSEPMGDLYSQADGGGGVPILHEVGRGGGWQSFDYDRFLMCLEVSGPGQRAMA